MRLPLKALESECLKLIYSDKITQEGSIELVIPDTCGDVGKILDVRGQLLINSNKSVSDGLIVSASVEVDIIFLDEDGDSIHTVSVQLPFEFDQTIKGATEDTDAVISMEMCRLDARTLNPRKLLVRAELSADIRCYNEDKFVLWETLENPEEYGIHLKREDIEHSLIMDIGEKSFTVSDEYNMPSDQTGDARTLSCVTEICIDDVKTVGNKVIFKATAKTNAVFLCSDMDISSANFETQFSQIIETDSVRENAQVNIIPYITASDFVFLPDREEGVIAANIKVCVQAICVANRASVYVADAYSNKFSIEAVTADVPVFSLIPSKQMKLRLEGSCGSEIDKVLYIYCGGVCSDINGSKLDFTARICGVGTNSDGLCVPLSATLRGSQELDLEANQRVDIFDICCCAPDLSDEGRIELEISYCISVRDDEQIDALCAIEVDEEMPVNSESRPSLVILCANYDASLWSLAKEYCSTIEAIRDANSLCGEFDEKTRPLLIPKV